MQRSLGIIGVGAFGEFALKHLIPYFPVTVYDSSRDLSDVAQTYNVLCGTFADAASRDVVVLAVPVRALDQVCIQLAEHVSPETLVVDVSSVKVRTCQILQERLANKCHIASVHPLFGPQSGTQGISGLCLALIDLGGTFERCIEEFCSQRLQLDVTKVSADQHDAEMAYVQGLTHLFANVFLQINPDKPKLMTPTYDLLCKSVDLVKNDSFELLRVIETDNPYVAAAKSKFFSAVSRLEDVLSKEDPYST